MKMHDIARPVGLNVLCEEVEKNCAEAQAYRRCGLSVPHLIVPLDPGNGRTTFIEYMVDMYKNAGVLDFRSGIDDYVEVSFDGTLPQLRQAFLDIDSCAVYANNYSGIVGMDISAIAQHPGETQYSEFIRGCRRICRHACAVFFVNAEPGKNEEKLIARLCESLESVKRVSAEAYTKDEICALIVKSVSERGVCIRREKEFCGMLPELVMSMSITDVRGAVSAAGEIARRADFSGFVPAVDERSVRSLIGDPGRNEERREAK